MDLFIEIPNTWMWFCICFGAAMFTSMLMSMHAEKFMTRDGSTRKFSIMNLEFPSSPLDIVNTIRGIYKLPEPASGKSLKALKNNLYIDFLFMPAIYGSIFLLCMHVSSKTTWLGHPAFALFAWLQIVCWLFDVIENIYLLRKIQPEVEASSNLVHNLYRYLVVIKWGIALLGGVCALMVLLYFWFTGRYNHNNLYFVFILLIEIAGLFLLKKLLTPKAKANPK